MSSTTTGPGARQETPIQGIQLDDSVPLEDDTIVNNRASSAQQIADPPGNASHTNLPEANVLGIVSESTNGASAADYKGFMDGESRISDSSAPAGPTEAQQQTMTYGSSSFTVDNDRANGALPPGAQHLPARNNNNAGASAGAAQNSSTTDPELGMRQNEVTPPQSPVQSSVAHVRAHQNPTDIREEAGASVGDDNGSAKIGKMPWIAAAVLLLIGLVVVGGVCGTGNCSGSGSDASSPRGGVEVENSTVPGVGSKPTNDVSGEGLGIASNPVAAPVGSGGGQIDPPTTSAPTIQPVQAPTSPPTTQPVRAASTTTLGRIRDRGVLRCGVLDDAALSVSTQPAGFSGDMCRALAAAVFGSATDTVSFVNVLPSSRFELLKNDEVDVLASATTHTMERQVFEPTTGSGFSFSTPYLYSGMTFAGIPPFGQCANSKITGNSTIGDCRQMKICVVYATTYETAIPNVLPGAQFSTVPGMQAFYRNLRDGLCNVLAGDQFETAAKTVESMGYFGEYETGDSFFSKEPLALVTRNDDQQWSDFVNWIVQSLLSAEEKSITQVRAAQMTTINYFGGDYINMFQNAIAEVGNYGEIYARHLEDVVSRKPVNKINQGDTGLMYSMPFGSTTPQGLGPKSGGTLARIRNSGRLRCGYSQRAIFGSFDTQTEQYSGFDIDFCKALSAAIFNGVTANIQYNEILASDRFQVLADGQVDVLTRVTTANIERDVLEPSAGEGFSFSQPNFYDGVGFGGIPPYHKCAEDRITNKDECRGLKICVNTGTTTLTRVKQLFAPQYIVEQLSGDLAAQGLAKGQCNAIAGGVFDRAFTNIRRVGGYTGPYNTTATSFSKDPLAVVTAQDDPEWSSFVYWVVSSLVYAEEEGITSETSFQMPIVNLFGPLYTRMLQRAVGKVGSYAEIYERNAEAEAPRTGLNLLNSDPLTPLHYPLPGFEK